jgi:hypothetical protein
VHDDAGDLAAADRCRHHQRAMGQRQWTVDLDAEHWEAFWQKPRQTLQSFPSCSRAGLRQVAGTDGTQSPGHRLDPCSPRRAEATAPAEDCPDADDRPAPEAERTWVCSWRAIRAQVHTQGISWFYFSSMNCVTTVRVSPLASVSVQVAV